MEMASRRWGDDQSALGRPKNRKKTTDRGKSGTKRSLLVDGRGVPLAIVVGGAQMPDGKLLEPTPEAMSSERPDPATTPQQLCLDKAFSGEPCAQVAKQHGYQLHVPDKVNAQKTQTPCWTPQTPALGGRSNTFLD